MVKRSTEGQLSLFDVERYSCQENYFDWEVDIERLELPKPKSTPVARKSNERVYFWVEEYCIHQRYLHYRFCYLSSSEGIERVEKIHIPGRSKSIREGRVQLIEKAIASQEPTEAIVSLIHQWRHPP